MKLIRLFVVAALAQCASAVHKKKSHKTQQHLRAASAADARVGCDCDTCDADGDCVYGALNMYPDDTTPKKATACKAKAKSNPHTWITHGYGCATVAGGPTREDLGCDIPAYTSGWTTAHWNIAFSSEEDPTGVLQTEIHESFMNCLDGASKPYPIPDFCSRAMVAELSQIYDGEQRVASTAAAIKHFGNDIGPTCDRKKDGSVKKSELGCFTCSLDDLPVLFKDTTRKMACWGLNHNYRELYCNVYAECDSTAADPNRDQTAIGCCKAKFNERTDRYRTAGVLSYLQKLPRYIDPVNGQGFTFVPRPASASDTFSITKAAGNAVKASGDAIKASGNAIKDSSSSLSSFG